MMCISRDKKSEREIETDIHTHTHTEREREREKERESLIGLVALEPNTYNRLEGNLFVSSLREHTHTHTLIVTQTNKHTLLWECCHRIFPLLSLPYDMFTKYLFRMLRKAPAQAPGPCQSPRMQGGKWRYYLSALAVS